MLGNCAVLSRSGHQGVSVFTHQVLYLMSCTLPWSTSTGVWKWPSFHDSSKARRRPSGKPFFLAEILNILPEWINWEVPFFCCLFFFTEYLTVIHRCCDQQRLQPRRKNDRDHRRSRNGNHTQMACGGFDPKHSTFLPGQNKTIKLEKNGKVIIHCL